jgi:hypothetical protein
VGLTVKILFLADGEDSAGGFRAQNHGSQHRLFGFKVLGRDPELVIGNRRKRIAFSHYFHSTPRIFPQGR